MMLASLSALSATWGIPLALVGVAPFLYYQDLGVYLPYIALPASVFILVAAVFNWTTFSAMAQLGSIQERLAPWSNLTAPKKDKSKEPPRVTLEERVSFTLGVLNVLLTAYIAGAFPSYYHLWHTPKCIILTLIRWWTFKKQKQHYLLYDFCYWANFLVLIYIWILPQNKTLFEIVWVVSNGPLACAVLAFSHSLIFHSHPHITSLFIHTSPMTLTHVIRWQSSPTEWGVCTDYPSCTVGSPLSMIWKTCIYFYLPWVCLYYMWVFVLHGKRIKERGYKTLFDRVVSKGFVGRLCCAASSSEHVQQLVYLMTHVVYSLFTMVLATLFWYNRFAHAIFIISLLATAAWNASTFYFDALVAQKVEAMAPAKKESASPVPVASPVKGKRGGNGRPTMDPKNLLTESFFSERLAQSMLSPPRAMAESGAFNANASFSVTSPCEEGVDAPPNTPAYSVPPGRQAPPNTPSVSGLRRR